MNLESAQAYVEFHCSVQLCNSGSYLCVAQLLIFRPGVDRSRMPASQRLYLFLHTRLNLSLCFNLGYGLWRMGYGLWRMANGLWPMDHCVCLWDMGYGVWFMGHGRWPMG
jgi:hypothetical protein